MKKISYDSWKIILACKGYSNVYDGDSNIDSKQVLKDYLGEYLLISEVDDCIMYRHLLSISFEIFDKTNLFKMFDTELTRELFFAKLDRKDNNNFYSLLCNILIRELRSLDVMNQEGDKFVDIYSIIDKKGNILTIEEANEMWIGKDKYLTLTKK